MKTLTEYKAEIPEEKYKELVKYHGRHGKGVSLEQWIERDIVVNGMNDRYSD